MEKKFTEGEWIIDKKRDTVCIDILCNDEVVATCWDDYDYVDQLRANAKLIAAAPDMFAALEYLIESVNPIDACRGKFESLGKDRAYIGEMTLPTAESILRCIEAIKKATE